MDFKQEFQRIIDKIESWKHFALARYGDGEKMLMCGEDVWPWTQASVQDKRESKGFSLLWNDLLHTLIQDSEDYIYAIPCQCCNERGKQRYFDNIKSRNFTYANIFINSNYESFKEWINNTKKKFNIIANIEWADKEYPFCEAFYPIWDDCVKAYENNKNDFINSMITEAKDNNNKIFLISAWPLANIFVYVMWEANPNNTYIDVWSALDERTKGRITRGFQRPQDFYAKRECIF